MPCGSQVLRRPSGGANGARSGVPSASWVWMRCSSSRVRPSDSSHHSTCGSTPSTSTSTSTTTRTAQRRRRRKRLWLLLRLAMAMETRMAKAALQVGPPSLRPGSASGRAPRPRGSLALRDYEAWVEPLERALWVWGFHQFRERTAERSGAKRFWF